MDQIGRRIKIVDSKIRISSPKNIFMLIFLPIWLTGWTIGGVITIGILVTGQSKEAWFLVVWLCDWIVGESFALYTFLWGLFGFEVITVELGSLRRQRSILGYGPSKTYETSKLSNLRASGFFGPMMSVSSGMAYWGLSGGTIAFDYEDKGRRLGISLNEDDSNQLVDALKTRLNL